jgi:hypothetical protein
MCGELIGEFRFALNMQHAEPGDSPYLVFDFKAFSADAAKRLVRLFVAILCGNLNAPACA